jgi:uncharacterized protein (DUF2062 family)
MTPPAPEVVAPRSPWGRFRAFLDRLVGMDDGPHEIALGLGIGIFVGFLPIMGIQMYVSVPMAWALGGNRALAAAGVWISNPVTFVPFYYACYRFGLLLCGTGEVDPSGSSSIGALLQEGGLENLDAAAREILYPLAVGSVMLGLVFGILTYFLTRSYLVRRRAAQAATGGGSAAAGP